MSASGLLDVLEREHITAYSVYRFSDHVRIVVEGNEDAASIVRVLREWLDSHGEKSSWKTSETPVFSPFPSDSREGRADIVAWRRLGDRDLLYIVEVKANVRLADRDAASYDVDFDLWARAQAALLRQGDWNNIDAVNVAEEIEDLSKRQHRELRNRLRVLTMHMLKWDYQPEQRSGSWRATVIEQRAQIQDLLSDSPSLENVIAQYAAETYETARDEAVAETGLREDAFPPGNPYTVDQLLAVPLRNE